MSDDFDGFLRSQWNEHNDHAQTVGQRLADSVARVRTPAQVGAYAALVTHVYGVHLADWERGAQVLAALRQSPGYDASPQAEGPIARSLAALALAGGDETAAAGLPAPDRIAAFASASSALLDRSQLARAIDCYGRALDLVATTPLPDGAPAIRHLAVGGNNLAQTLEDHADRTPAQTAAMLRAAGAALANWQRCGGWLEHERAEYRVARSHLRAGQAAEALAAAQRCVRICEREDAPAFERFFGHTMAALALAADGRDEAAQVERDRALAAHAAVPADERPWCADDLQELQARMGAPA